MRACLTVAMLVAFAAGPCATPAQNTTLRIPPQKIPFTIKDQAVTITASAAVTLAPGNQSAEAFKLELTADLSNLQKNFTALLAAQLDKDDTCGDRIQIQNASLVPAPPASLATVQLHYDRYGCAKVLGKEKTARLISGNAQIQLKLTPTVEQNDTGLRLVAEMAPIQADGSLGELLNSGSLGDMLREKIRESILDALQKGTNLSATLPPALQGRVAIEGAQFRDGGAGRLLAVLNGEGRITQEQIQALAKQIQQRAASTPRN
jgi:hypothetical protein